MGAFTFKLEREGGMPADPPKLSTAVPNWGAGDERARDVDNEATRLLRRLRERGSRALPTAGSDNRPETLYIRTQG